MSNRFETRREKSHSDRWSVIDRVAAVEGAVIRRYSDHKKNFCVCPILLFSISQFLWPSFLSISCTWSSMSCTVSKLICCVSVVLCVRGAVLLCEVGGSVLLMMSVLRVQLDWITDWPLDLICRITTGAAFPVRGKTLSPVFQSHGSMFVKCDCV